MNILKEIIEHKKSEVKRLSEISPIEQIKESQRLFQIRDFKSALNEQNISIIAEIKFKSPSMGVILENLSPTEIAKSYENNGASAISVLTDYKYFGGNLDYIHQIKAVCNLPILRKDFIIFEYQIWESFHAGADAILLISDALEFSQLENLYNISTELGLSVLVEAHSKTALENALKLNPEIIGINCRDLKTMETNLDYFESTISEIKSVKIKVAESGIHNSDDLKYISEIGYSSALVGTSLMKSGNPGLALTNLLNRVPG